MELRTMASEGNNLIWNNLKLHYKETFLFMIEKDEDMLSLYKYSYKRYCMKAVILSMMLQSLNFNLIETDHIKS